MRWESCFATGAGLNFQWPRSVFLFLSGAFGVLVMACILLPAQSIPSHTVTIEDLQGLKDADWLKLSPDGKKVAYTVNGEIWIAETKSAASAKRICKGRLPIWSSSSMRFAYYTDTDDGLQLSVFDLDTNQNEQVTYVKGGIDPDPSTIMLGYILNPLKYSWSPDGTGIVFTSQLFSKRPKILSDDSVPTSQKDGDPLVLTNDTPAGWTLSGLCAKLFGEHHWAFWEKDRIQSIGGVSHLFIVNIKSKAVRQLTSDDLGYFNPDWSPDGRKIVCASLERRSMDSSLGSGTTNIYVFDLGAHSAKRLTDDSLGKWMPSWSPDGSEVAYQGSAAFGLRKLFVVPAAGGPAVDLTAELHRGVNQFQWASDGKSVFAVYNDGVSTPLARIDISRRTAKPIGDNRAARRSTLSASNNDALMWQESDPLAPAAIYQMRPNADLPQMFLDLNPQVKEWDLGEQEVVHWKNHGGNELEGVLIKPPGYQEGHRYPVIVDAYPFQGNSFKDSAMMGNQAWASKGYVVFWPSAPAPHVWENPFKSEQYNQAAKGPQGWDITVDDVLSGLDHLIAQGIVDPERMCLYGFSNGAGVVNYLVTRTNRFKCAISIAAAMSDWVRPSLMETESWVPPLNDGVTVWEDPEAYLRLSAVFYLNRVKTPMLLADGDDDKGFLLNTIEMYNGLRHFKQEVIFLRYPGQEHGFTGASMTDFWKRETAFVEAHLK